MLRPELRAAYYDRAVPDDSILRAELEQLVAECERRDSLLDVGAGVRFADLLAGDSAATPIGETRRSSKRRWARRTRSSASSAAAGCRACSSPTRPRSAAGSSSRSCRRSWRPGISAERFEREIKLAASLQQANIVPVLAAGRAGDVPYYTMPFVEGASLRARLAREGALPIRRCREHPARRRARARVRARARRRASRHQAGQHAALGRRGGRHRLRHREGPECCTCGSAFEALTQAGTCSARRCTCRPSRRRAIRTPTLEPTSTRSAPSRTKCWQASRLSSDAHRDNCSRPT